MKRKLAAVFLAGALSMTMAVPAQTVFAETESEETAQTEDAAEGKDVDITVNGEAYTIKNDTGIALKTVEYKEENDPEEKDKTVWNLVLTEENGTEHILSDVVPDPVKWKNTVLVNQFGFFYIQYQDESGKDQDIAETAKEKVLEPEQAVYAITGVNLRETASTDAAVLTILKLGDEVTAEAVVPGWVKVKKDDKEGYVAYRYLTADKAAVDQLLEAQAAAAAAAAAQAAASSSYSAPSYSAPADNGGGGDGCLDDGLMF